MKGGERKGLCPSTGGHSSNSFFVQRIGTRSAEYNFPASNGIRNDVPQCTLAYSRISNGVIGIRLGGGSGSTWGSQSYPVGLRAA